MRDYSALEALAAQNPRMNDMRITTPTKTFSMRSDFGLWLKRGSPQIGKPETDSMLVEVPGADFLLDLTRAVDGSVHHKKRKISMEFVCDRPKTQWAYIRSRLEALLQGQWLHFYFVRDGEVWAGQLDVEMTPGEYKASVKITATCDPWPKARHARRRLTSPDFFARYDKVLVQDGQVEFKTDNRDLFDFSVESLGESETWGISECTYDLHHDEIMNVGNIMTEYEEKFSSMDHPICKLIAKRRCLL